MQSPFTKKAIDIIAAIPSGKVSTYGIIAAHAGNSRGARQVARILHSSSRKYDLPWHRVVNRDGKISLPKESGYELQKELLRDENVEFEEGDRIDFERFLWWPKLEISGSSYYKI
ncbi:MGMT family protein [Desulfopila inferna]|uniref:MGMT family protein n=1 Tax=Desulfopila inferna TaxID=468528 RepID=UPI001962353F|nr:MGMT family protein [Desulfopila inferna]